MMLDFNLIIMDLIYSKVMIGINHYLSYESVYKRESYA
jgi:hypothetical protein